MLRAFTDFNGMCMKSLWAFLFVVVTASCVSSCAGRESITYYRGYMPEYRWGPGRFYPVDKQGNFMALSMDYREGAAQGSYYCPGTIRTHEDIAIICDYGTQWQKGGAAVANAGTGVNRPQKPSSVYEQMLAGSRPVLPVQTIPPQNHVPANPVAKVDPREWYNYCDNDTCYTMPWANTGARVATPAATQDQDNDALYTAPHHDAEKGLIEYYNTYWANE